MTARAARRAGPDPVGAFIALAADPERFQQAKDDLDRRREAAEQAEASAQDRDRAALIRLQQAGDLEAVASQRLADAESAERRNQVKQAELESRESVCAETERRLSADRERVLDASARMVALLRARFESFANEARGEIASSMEIVA